MVATEIQPVLQDRMKAIVIHRYGPPDVLSYEDVPDPEPRAGEIRIRIHAATVNRVLDVSLRAGRESAREPVLPLIPGVDCAGVVDAVGPGVAQWRAGMRVAAAGMMPLAFCAEDGKDYAGPIGMMGIKRPGGFAELVTVPACAAIPLPDGLDFHRAAVVMRHVPTAWNLLFNVAGLKAGETVLIMGAAGNLGTIGIQIAKNVIGARVIAAAGSDERVRVGLDLGADHGINYNTQDILAEAMKITAGKGVDVLYDNIANPKVLPRAFLRDRHERPAGDRRRPWRARRHDQFFPPLPQAHHHQGPARLSSPRRAEMLRGRGRGKGRCADRAGTAARARRRRAPPGRIGRLAGQDRARSDAWMTHCARGGGMPIFRSLPVITDDTKLRPRAGGAQRRFSP